MPNQKLTFTPPMVVAKTITGPVASITSQNGVTIVVPGTPLTRLNYFDGKFLRADDLQKEQTYLRALAEFSNQVGGSGVARGLSASLQSGNQILLSSGLAIDPMGRLLLLTESQVLNIPDLLATTTRAAAAQTRTAGAAFADCVTVAADSRPALVIPSTLYLLVIAHAEALCGEEDVYGKLCQEACITSTNRPYRLEGIVARLVPLTLTTPLPASKAVTLATQHLRSRVASAYFEDECHLIDNLISRDGLQSEVWCMGAEGVSGIYVPLGVVGWTGSAASFFDAWTARRERMDPPAKRYWQWRMNMRPWDVFMAQVLQFQCQLRDGLQTGPAGGTMDPCQDTRQLVGEAAAAITELHNYYRVVSAKLATANIDTTTDNIPITGGTAQVTGLIKRMSQAQKAVVFPALDRLLIRQGIIELPSAGYLPVTPGAAMTVNQQVRQWMGEGVDLRFCVVTPDYVQHALEEAQHMERISLIDGLDHPDRKPHVDILVPNGKMEVQTGLASGRFFEASVTLKPQSADATPVTLTGAGRSELLQTGGAALYVSAKNTPLASQEAVGSLNLKEARFSAADFVVAKANPAERVTIDSSIAIWSSLVVTCNPFDLAVGDSTPVTLQLDVLMPRGDWFYVQMRGELVPDEFVPLTAAIREMKGTLIGLYSRASRQNPDPLRGEVKCAVVAALNQDQNAGPVLRVSLNLDKLLGGSLRVTFQNGKAGIRVAVTQQLQRQFVSAEAFQFQENPDVAQFGNAQHDLAVSAIDMISAARSAPPLNDTKFRDRALLSLFPPPPPPSEELIVTATLDWVLFQRRRTKQCQPDKVVATVPSRRYQLWHGMVVASEDLPAIIQALHDKSPLNPGSRSRRVTFQRVDILEFAPGTVTLLSQRTAVQSDWTNVNPGQDLVYYGIASTDAAKLDGDTLALGRLQELERTIEPISHLTPQTLRPDVLPEIHPELAVPGVDGIIVVLTITEKVSHNVWEVPPDKVRSVINAVKDHIALESVLNEAKAEPLGHVDFQLKTSEVVDDGLMTEVVRKWGALKVLAPIGALTLFFDGDEATLKASWIEQAKVILTHLGAPEATIISQPITQNELGNLGPVVTLIAPGQAGIGPITHL